jgi:hypothetical protein
VVPTVVICLRAVFRLAFSSCAALSFVCRCVVLLMQRPPS